MFVRIRVRGTRVYVLAIVQGGEEREGTPCRVVTSELYGLARATALAHVSNAQKAVENRRKPTSVKLTTPER